jgi:hypothetical protein
MVFEHDAIPHLGWNPDLFANQIENDEEIPFFEPLEDRGDNSRRCAWLVNS